MVRRESAIDLNINYWETNDGEDYGKGRCDFDAPADMIFPGLGVTQELFTGFLGFLGNENSENDGFGAAGEFVNLLAIEFVSEGTEETPDMKIENIIYYNYAELSGCYNPNNGGRIELDVSIPEGKKMRIAWLGNLRYNSAIGTSDGSENVTIGLKKSTWIVRESSEFTKSILTDDGTSRLRNVYAGLSYGGTYSQFHGTTHAPIDNIYGPKYSLQSPDDLGWDWEWLNQKHNELYGTQGSDENSNGFTASSYPYVDQVYLNMYRYKDAEGVWRFMRASRCGETARVWLSIPFVDDNMAIRLKGVPHLNNKVYRVSEIKGNQIPGIRTGTMPLIQREFSNPSRGRFANIQSQDNLFNIDNQDAMFTPDSDEHGIFGDFEDETFTYNYMQQENQNAQHWYNYQDFSNPGEYYDRQTNWMEYIAANYGAEYAQFPETVSEFEFVSSSQSGAGQYYFDSTTGQWTSYSTDYSEWTSQINNWTSVNTDYETWITYVNIEFEYIPEAIVFNVMEGLPLNRSLTAYEPKQETEHENGFWTYIDIDIDTRLMTEGIYKLEVEFGYWNQYTYEFEQSVIQSSTKELYFNVKKELPRLKYQYNEVIPITWSPDTFREIFSEGMESENLLGWAPFIDQSGTGSQLWQNTYLDENDIFMGASNLIENFESERTAHVWRISFGIESTAGVIARKGENKWNYAYTITEGSSPVDFYNNMNDYDSWSVAEAMKENLKVGDILHSLDGLESYHWLDRGFVFNNYLIQNPSAQIRIQDILGNISYALFERGDYQINHNASLTQNAIDTTEIYIDDSTGEIKNNCNVYTDDGAGGWDLTEIYHEPMPMNLYQIQGQIEGDACDNEGGSCCDVWIKDEIKMWPENAIKASGITEEYLCGIDDNTLNEFANYFNNWQALTPTMYSNQNPGGFGFNGNTSFFQTEGWTDMTFPWGWDNEDLENIPPGRVLLDIVAMDVYTPEGNPIYYPGISEDCTGPVVKLIWYDLAPCNRTKPLDSDVFAAGGHCACSPRTQFGIDFNRGFNMVIPNNNLQNLESHLPTTIKPSISNQMLAENYLGQYECTSCIANEIQHSLPTWDFFQAPCGIGYGLLGPANVTIYFDDLESNDFSNANNIGTYHLSGIWYMNGVCTIQLIDDNGQPIGDPIGNCNDATLNPYTDAIMEYMDITTIPNYEFAVAMKVSNCGSDMIMCQTLTFSLEFNDFYTPQPIASNLTIDWNGDGDISGCTDYGAYNFNPNAVFPCADCCEYPDPIEPLEYDIQPGLAEGSKVALVYSADLQRWDQVDMEENVYGAIMGRKGEVLMSSFSLETLSQSRLKNFQGSELEGSKQDYTWTSKAMTFGYDNIYKSIKRIKITLTKSYNTEDEVPIVNLFVKSAPFANNFVEISQEAEDTKTLKYEIPRNARKCKTLQFMITGKQDIESVAIIYTMKGIK